LTRASLHRPGSEDGRRRLVGHPAAADPVRVGAARWGDMGRNDRDGCAAWHPGYRNVNDGRDPRKPTTPGTRRSQPPDLAIDRLSEGDRAIIT